MRLNSKHVPRRVVHRYLRVPETTARRLEHNTTQRFSVLDTNFASPADSQPHKPHPSKTKRCEKQSLDAKPGQAANASGVVIHQPLPRSERATFAGVADDSRKRMTGAEQPHKGFRRTDARVYIRYVPSWRTSCSRRVESSRWIRDKNRRGLRYPWAEVAAKTGLFVAHRTSPRTEEEKKTVPVTRGSSGRIGHGTKSGI